MAHPKAYTTKEDADLTALWPDLTVAAIGVAMGRSEQSVRERARRIGLPSKNAGRPGRGMAAKVAAAASQGGALWTEEEDAELTRLWGSMTARDIAEKMRRPRNSVIGRANRLGLADQSRRSPIKPYPAAPPAKFCQWPIGDPAAADFRFCGGSTEQGKPYCATHCAVAYRQPKPQEAEEISAVKKRLQRVAG